MGWIWPMEALDTAHEAGTLMLLLHSQAVESNGSREKCNPGPSASELTWAIPAHHQKMLLTTGFIDLLYKNQIINVVAGWFHICIF